MSGRRIVEHFFEDDPPPLIGDDAEQYRPPPWSGPPEDVVGRPVDVTAMVARTPPLAVVADGFRAYPTGVRFDAGAVLAAAAEAEELRPERPERPERRR